MFSEFFSRLVAEFIGTFLFVLTVPLSTIAVGVMAPIPVGMMLTSMGFAFGRLSGAHFNPAISLSVFLNGKMTGRNCVAYIISQLLASVAASLYGSAMVGLDLPAPEARTLKTAWQVTLTELIFTAAIITVVLHVKYSRQRSNEFYALATGASFMASGLAVGGATHGSFNPAVATGTQLVAALGESGELTWSLLIFWLGPIAGAILASIAYQVLDTEVGGFGAEVEVQPHRVY